MEQLVKNKSGKGKQKPNVVWVRVDFGLQRNLKAADGSVIDNDTFAETVEFKAELYMPNKKGDANNRSNWDKVGTAELSASVAVPSPSFLKKRPSINNMLVEQLVGVIKISTMTYR